VTLVATLGAPSGDIARSSRYRDAEYLHWEVILLYIDGETADIEHLRAEVTVKMAKGYKDYHDK
jgi:hypothetical protein